MALTPLDDRGLSVNMAEAARMLGVSRPTIINLISDGRIQTIHIGRRRLIPISELERFLRDELQLNDPTPVAVEV